MENTTGLSPCEFNVIVEQDAVEEKTKGGILLPDNEIERAKHRQTLGTIRAIAPLAFNEDVWPGGVERPQIGQRIAFALHAGTFINAPDGTEYRVIKDKDVVALIEAVT